MSTGNSAKNWDGTLESSTDASSWSVWDGTTALSSGAGDEGQVLYLRGTNNTRVAGNGGSYKWVLTGADIKCQGNIENLLDYATVASGGHPAMASSCFTNLFYQCASLTQAPALPATALADFCYSYMFYQCTGLTKAPALPATTLMSNCYYNMFNGCTSLTQAPDLSATTLALRSCMSMFRDCTSLTQAPALPATTLASNCYYGIFNGCTSLAQAPALPATTLTNYCYSYMFQNCTGLTQAPALPATTLIKNCYRGMFYDCTGVRISETETGEYTMAYRVPKDGEGTDATDALTDMFTNTGGAFTGTPVINTTYYLSASNTIV